MNEVSLKKALSSLNIGGLRYFDSIGSTNDEALAWAASGAADFSLVIADEQTRGRGRLNRKWFTPPGSALAASLILRPNPAIHARPSRVVGLAALALAETCRTFNLNPRIKWPNDILVNGKKIAGILVETVWSGAEIDSLVIGMGINIYKASVPPADLLQFPASSLEDEINTLPPREEILRRVFENFVHWRAKIGADEFISAWENLLAFRGEQVQIHSAAETISGKLLGLDLDGSLRLLGENRQPAVIHFGDVSLRPSA